MTYVEIDLNIDSELKTEVFWGKLSNNKNESEQDAAKDTVDYLQRHYKFEVCDVNFSNYKYYKWCYNRMNRGYDETAEENRALKDKIKKYKNILNRISNDDCESSTADNL